MNIPLFALCTRCGSPAVEVMTEDYAYCGPCEEAHQRAFVEEFPFGQCWQCGVAYREATCEQGKTHVFANHIEGACGAWGDAPPLREEDVAAGYCSYGCRPHRG